jgi:hypothetical protein
VAESMFEKPNLKESNIDTLEFSTKLELGTELNNLIKEKATMIGPTTYLFAESYTLSRAKHTFKIQVDFTKAFSIKSKKTVQATEIDFKFLLTPRVNVPKSVSNPNDIIGVLNKIKKDHTFSCYVTYDYKKQDKRKFILSLPIKISESPIFPFETVDGVGVRGKIENIDYSSLVATMPIHKNTHLLIIFEQNYYFNNNVAEKIIADSNIIVNRLMVSSGG